MRTQSRPEVLERIRTLFTRGPVGHLSDGTLLEYFLTASDSAREDAFAALVERHGPLVYGVCRRVLHGSADADDAFQAVWIVLARRAASLRRSDDLRPWLHGVALRTASEARRRAQQHPTVDLDQAADHIDTRAPSSADHEAVTIVDHEVEQLPPRYRLPILLCELEGHSRQQAAERLGLPEGTLSSRLSRGRTLLRERLERRGFSSEALGLLPAAVRPPCEIMAAAIRYATQRGGASPNVPMALISLAEGVITMMRAARMKTLAITCGISLALSAVAGLSWGALGKAPRPVTTQQNVVERIVKDYVHGRVVDQEGRPVTGAVVRLMPYRSDEVVVHSGTDGAFTIGADHELPKFQFPLLAHSADHAVAGLVSIGEAPEAIRRGRLIEIRLEPTTELRVTVRDRDDQPLSGATVEATGGELVVVDSRRSGADGSCVLRLPRGVRLHWVVGLKAGSGLDVFTPGNDARSGRLAEHISTKLTGLVVLRLAGSQPSSVRTVNEAGRPIEGALVHVWEIKFTGGSTRAILVSRATSERTDADGFAHFDWLPKEGGPLTLDAREAQSYTPMSMILNPPYTAAELQLRRCGIVKGRVTWPDGMPAAHIWVTSSGPFDDKDHYPRTTSTDINGRYELLIPETPWGGVGIENGECAAPSRFGLKVEAGKTLEGFDFRLSKGTLIHGRLTALASGKALVDREVVLVEEIVPPAAEAEKLTSRDPRLRRNSRTDAEGRYRFRVGPGRFRLSIGDDPNGPVAEVVDQAEINVDYPRPDGHEPLNPGQIHD